MKWCCSWHPQTFGGRLVSSFITLYGTQKNQAPKQPQASKQLTLGFFKSIPASVYSPAFYAGIAGRSFWKGFWYFMGVSFFVLAVWALLFVLAPYLKHKETINSTVDSIVHFYPEELVLTIQDGKLSSNSEQPYAFKLTDFISTEDWNARFKEGFEEGMSQNTPVSVDLEELNILVIDTQTPYSIEEFFQHQTIAWVSSDAIYVMSENKRIEAIPLAEVPNIVIDKALVDETMETALKGMQSFIPILGSLLFVGAFIGLVLFRMAYLLFFALVFLLASTVMKLSHNFGASYKIGFYAITLPSFLMPLLLASPFPMLAGVPFLFTLVSLIVAIVNLNGAKNAGLIKETKKA